MAELSPWNTERSLICSSQIKSCSISTTQNPNYKHCMHSLSAESLLHWGGDHSETRDVISYHSGHWRIMGQQSTYLIYGWSGATVFQGANAKYDSNMPARSITQAVLSVGCQVGVPGNAFPITYSHVNLFVSKSRRNLRLLLKHNLPLTLNKICRMQQVPTKPFNVWKKMLHMT